MTLFSLGKIFSSKMPAPLTPVTPTHIYSITLVYSGATRVKLQYNTDICQMNEKSVYTINRSQVLVNGKPASNALAGDLAARCGSVIYPLQVQVGDSGDILLAWNYTEIRQRWQAQETQLLQYFTGEDAIEYIAATADTMNDPDRFLQSIRQDLFLRTYFHLLRGSKRVAYTLRPFAPPLLFDITQQRLAGGDIHQHGQCDNGSLEIKASFMKGQAFLRLIEGRWNQGEQEVALRAFCLTEEDAPLKTEQHG
jgi:hypothetical protein